MTLLSIDLFVSTMQEPGEIVFHWTVTTLVWNAGYGLRAWERRTRTALDRAARAERDRDEQARLAVPDERAPDLPRAARRRHPRRQLDRHAGGGGEQAARTTPCSRGPTMGHIRNTGNGAPGEMRRLVGMLRRPPRRRRWSRSPGWTALDELRRAVAGGRPVR